MSEQKIEKDEPYVCPASLNIGGKHYPCDWMEQMVPGSIGHDGWAHANRESQAIWTSQPSSIPSVQGADQ